MGGSNYSFAKFAPFLVAASTVTAQFAEYVAPSTVIDAVTVHVPAFTGVITPAATVAIVSSELVQVTADPAGDTVAVTVATSNH